MPGRFEAEFKLRGSYRPLFLADLGFETWKQRIGLSGHLPTKAAQYFAIARDE